MAERNYPCDNLILGYFGNGSKAGSAAALDEVGETAFKRQLYQCMVAQALALKSDIENRRAKGKLYLTNFKGAEDGDALKALGVTHIAAARKRNPPAPRPLAPLRLSSARSEPGTRNRSQPVS